MADTTTTTASYRGKSAAQINQIMKHYIPETSDNTFADFPMTYNKWYQPNETTPKDGLPCFIRTENFRPTENGGIKSGYVWGPGPYGFGYYHLLTKAAHVTIYNRIHNNKVFLKPTDDSCCSSCFGGSGSSTDPNDNPNLIKLPIISKDDRDDMRLLFHGRSVASAGNDRIAQKDQMSEATTVAQLHYNMDQNIQLGIGIANGMTR